ncbi:MAG: hypothetical protein ACRCYK_11795 [Aeromonas hydrophila]
MRNECYLFLFKGTLVIAQSLSAPETGEVLISLLQQGFVVAPLQVRANNTRQALACYSCSEQQRAFTSLLASTEPTLTGTNRH